MLDELAWLSLEVLYADRAREFYRGTFGLEPIRREETTVFPIGGQELRLVEPGPVPRGGLHVHFAMATPPDEFDDWLERLGRDHDLAVHQFGSSRSLYLDDPDGHCVEIGSVGDPDAEGSFSGIFEVVLEVEDLASAEAFYTALGFSVVDRGDRRQRIRLTGPMDLELWEPQRGLADARGGVHVDLGFIGRAEVDSLPSVVRDRALAIEKLQSATRIRDPDGHYLTISSE